MLAFLMSLTCFESRHRLRDEALFLRYQINISLRVCACYDSSRISNRVQRDLVGASQAADAPTSEFRGHPSRSRVRTAYSSTLPKVSPATDGARELLLHFQSYLNRMGRLCEHTFVQEPLD